MVINSNLVTSELKYTATKNHKSLTRTTEPHKSNKKTQDLLLNTSSGNCVLYSAGYRPAQEFESPEYDKNQWFMYTLIWLIQITQHSQSVYIVNLYTVSIDNPVIMPIFLIDSLALCFGFPTVIYNHEIWATKLFFITKYWGNKQYCVPPCPKVGGHVPPTYSVPESQHSVSTTTFLLNGISKVKLIDDHETKFWNCLVGEWTIIYWLFRTELNCLGQAPFCFQAFLFSSCKFPTFCENLSLECFICGQSY